MATEQGYSNQKKKGTPQFKTIHPVNSNAFAESVITKGLYDIGENERDIIAVTDILGNDGQVAFWQITSIGANAVVGNVMRLSSSASSPNFELDIVKVINADNFYVLPIAEVKPQTSDGFFLMGWVTARFDAFGNPQVTLDTPDIGILDAGNSSTTALGANQVFTGAQFDITKYATINVNVMSNVPSATNGVTIQFSTDGVNWDHSHSTTYTAATGVGYIFNAEFRFARVVYTNGGTAQSFFRLQTIIKTTYVPSSLYTLSQQLSSNMFAQLNRSIITGETTGGGGGYVNVKVNPSGALVADVTGSVSQTALAASYQEITNLTSSVQTITPPAGAKWCKIYAPDTNVANIRVRLAGTATTTSGIQFQPGRSEDFNAVGTAISVIAESGTNQVINVHFGV